MEEKEENEDENQKRREQSQITRTVMHGACADGIWGNRSPCRCGRCKKAPPLVNLAEEKDVKVTVGENMDLKNADLLTDGDKYYLQHDATGNKEGNNWENYQEQGTEVTSTAEGKKVCGCRWIWVHPIRWKSST